MNVAFYIRVSTADQNPELQRRELLRYAAAREWNVLQTYTDVASGANSQRPELLKLMAAARRREFDAVLVWKLDRFGRSLSDLVGRLQELEGGGIRFLSATEAIDTDQKTPGGRLMTNLLAAFAEFERALITERSAAGMKRYTADLEAGRVGNQVHSKSGKDLPPHRPRAVFDRQRARELHQVEGKSIREICKLLGGVSRGSVQRAVKEI